MPSFINLLALAAGASAVGVYTTPHDKYSSSIGVLGCHINTDRVAYWPGSVDCDKICVKVTYSGRSVHLLRIDQSGGAYDISYDAWVYLQTGQSASANPISGGTVAMEYEEVDASECADLIHTTGSRLPLSASNSMNFLTSCLSQPNSYVAKNHVLINICDAICSMGFDEECTLDLAVSNQPSCPHTLGLTSSLTSSPVYNIDYQTGKTSLASTGEIVTSPSTSNKAASEPAAEQPAYSEPASSSTSSQSSAAVVAPEPSTSASVGSSTGPSGSSTSAEKSNPNGAVFVEQSTSQVAQPSPTTSSSSTSGSTSGSSSGTEGTSSSEKSSSTGVSAPAPATTLATATNPSSTGVSSTSSGSTSGSTSGTTGSSSTQVGAGSRVGAPLALVGGLVMLFVLA